MDKTKILLLDDREENLLSLKAILDRDDIAIYETTSPNEALRIVWDNDIAVALVDVQMPGMDGFEFAETLASNPKTKEILIIFVTAISKETTYAVRGLKSGAIDYLYKPLDPYITNAKVDALIRLSRSQREVRDKNRLLENYATVVTNSPDIIATIEPETGRIKSINPSVNTILGLSPADLINTSMLDLLVEPRSSNLQEVLVKRSYTEGNTIVIEDRFVGMLRQPVWLELRLMYKNRLLFVNLHDIGKRKAYERDLVDAQQVAERARKTKESFLANMSHEIRTPLNGIIGIANVLEATELDFSQRNLLEMLTQSSASLLNILNDILDISKIDEGKFSIVLQSVDLRNLIKGILDLLKFKADEKQIALRSYVDPNVPECVMADGLRLNQILMNLAGNALKFTASGSVEVRVENTGSVGQFHQIRFSVVDTGIGISQDAMANIFSEYGQATDKTAHLYGGTGLGLTISKKLVGLMNGELKVESEINKGSEFYFTFNLAEEKRVVASKESVPFNELAPFTGKKVLVAEDNKVNALLIRKYLTSWNVDLTMVENGQEVIDALSDGKFDILILDTRMPVMDGFEAARFIRQNMKLDIPILSLSATVLAEEVQEALSAGMNDTLAKPFQPAKLHEKIEALI
ncbi:hybrid sensor histidine kinase/response regulator [Dyadobacter luteus]|uniref:Sensory/regulatory protein RpfC n=1 Tax=Dyadobacter luteus TaxID=2259619 RepID=A0A3D8YHE7_9BACT|nr:response regulator [Dyadobacter luteus]REA64105.1 hybrid sensor histidine kinase/response regulator [Dyadobacter luteus]